MTLGQQALEITILVSAPMLLAALVTGLLVSIFQAATQINEMTLSFIPKLLAMFVVMVLAGPWMLSVMLDYMQRLYARHPVADRVRFTRPDDQRHQRAAERLAGRFPVAARPASSR